MQKLNALLLGAFIVLVSGCPGGLPKNELCLVYGNMLLCEDERRDPKEYVRTVEESQDYLCTNPDDYVAVKDYIDRKLTECDAKKCQR